MVKKEADVRLENGLEARPVALLVQVASQYDSQIYIENRGRRVNAKSIMGMMTLVLAANDHVIISADGPDEEAAATAVAVYLEGR